MTELVSGMNRRTDANRASLLGLAAPLGIGFDGQKALCPLGTFWFPSFHMAFKGGLNWVLLTRQGLAGQPF